MFLLKILRLNEYPRFRDRDRPAESGLVGETADRAATALGGVDPGESGEVGDWATGRAVVGNASAVSIVKPLELGRLSVEESGCRCCCSSAERSRSDEKRTCCCDGRRPPDSERVCDETSDGRLVTS
jgi:hypothetical protein